MDFKVKEVCGQLHNVSIDLKKEEKTFVQVRII